MKNVKWLALILFTVVMAFQNCGKAPDARDNSGYSIAGAGSPGPTPSPSPGPTPGPSPAPAPSPTPMPAPFMLKNQFKVLPQSGAIPSIRQRAASAFLTGKNKFFVWGGITGNVSTTLNTGGIYDLATGVWTATSTVGAPPPLYNMPAVWTGSKVLIWGGAGAVSNTSLYSYDPDTQLWATLPQSNAPQARTLHVSVWTGTKLIVWGGFNGGHLNTGGVYDPATGNWTATALPPDGLGRSGAFGAWTGSKMIIWGGTTTSSGFVQTALAYDPANNTWSTINSVGSPTGRWWGASAWTGNEFVVVTGGAGAGNTVPTNTGGALNLTTNVWTPTTTTNAAARVFPASGWTGTSLIIWGGYNGAQNTNTGYIFE